MFCCGAAPKAETSAAETNAAETSAAAGGEDLAKSLREKVNALKVCQWRQTLSDSVTAATAS